MVKYTILNNITWTEIGSTVLCHRIIRVYVFIVLYDPYIYIYMGHCQIWVKLESLAMQNIFNFNLSVFSVSLLQSMAF